MVNAIPIEAIAKPINIVAGIVSKASHECTIPIAAMIAKHGKEKTKTWLEGVKANLTQKLSNGFVRLHLKSLDDRTPSLMPVPVIDRASTPTVRCASCRRRCTARPTSTAAWPAR